MSVFGCISACMDLCPRQASADERGPRRYCDIQGLNNENIIYLEIYVHCSINCLIVAESHCVFMVDVPMQFHKRAWTCLSLALFVDIYIELPQL